MYRWQEKTASFPLALLFSGVLAAPAVLAVETPQQASERKPAIRAMVAGQGAAFQVDGRLDEPAWSEAPVYDNFHQYLPEDGKAAPPAYRTSVQMVVDEQALVFGIRAWDPEPGALQGSLARRDKVDRDQDFIGIWLDPSGHGRNAQFVRVNISGVVSDGMYRSDNDEYDLGPDFPVDAAVTILPDGYSMEIRWPLSNVRVPYGEGKAWRAMIERSVPHADGMVLLSAALKKDSLSFIAELQEVDGIAATVSAVRDRAFLELRPELTMRRQEVSDAAGRREINRNSLGLEISARPRADWVFNATVNPDFSQVEIDEPTTSGASRIALSLPEKRGFFLESADVLGLRLASFYSRTVADPQWGLRATWRGVEADATAMSLRDQAGGLVLRGSPYATVSYDQTLKTSVNLLRTRWHQGETVWGALVSSRDYGAAGSNEVAGIDGQWTGTDADGGQRHAVWALMQSRDSVNFDGARARPAVKTRDGSYLWGRYSQRSGDWTHELFLQAISPGFVNDNGFVPQSGIVQGNWNVIRRLGPARLGTGEYGVDLYELETHVWLEQTRTLADATRGQPSGEVVQRLVQPGFWLFGPRQTRFWLDLGFDQFRAHTGGRLHDTPALHFGLESSPFPWLAKLSGEFTVGRRLDVDADRVGAGGNVLVDLRLRFGLPGGWALESDHRWNRAWVNGALGQPAFADSGWRWLGMLHVTPRDSLRLLLQNTAAARRDDGLSGLDPWAERGQHRSLLYRHLWRHGRSLALGLSRDTRPLTREADKSLTVKLQWEI